MALFVFTVFGQEGFVVVEGFYCGWIGQSRVWVRLRCAEVMIWSTKGKVREETYYYHPDPP